MSTLIIISLAVSILNIPFGYWRANVKRFSAQWFLAIHIPVPFIVALRIFSGIGFAWYTYVFLIGGFFLDNNSETSYGGGYSIIASAEAPAW